MIYQSLTEIIGNTPLLKIKAMDCFSTTYIPENLLRSSFFAKTSNPI